MRIHLSLCSSFIDKRKSTATDGRGSALHRSVHAVDLPAETTAPKQGQNLW